MLYAAAINYLLHVFFPYAYQSSCLSIPFHTLPYIIMPMTDHEMPLLHHSVVSRVI